MPLRVLVAFLELYWLLVPYLSVDDAPIDCFAELTPPLFSGEEAATDTPAVALLFFCGSPAPSVDYYYYLALPPPLLLLLLSLDPSSIIGCCCYIKYYIVYCVV